jgi:exosome complex component RRP40
LHAQKTIHYNTQKEMDENYLQNKQTTDNIIHSIENNLDLSFQPRIILPGDDLTETLSKSASTVKIGAGLMYSKERVISTNVGELSYRPPSTYWVKSSKKRYYPKVGDQVVGVIEEKGGDFYIVNIFSGSSCILNRLAFEGATKRNRPELKKGDVVYARVTIAGNDCDTELSCISTTGSKKEWSSGETVYGLLSQGLVVNVNSATARRLLRPDCAVLNALGR